MKIFKKLNSQGAVFQATIRMRAKEYQALRDYMHTKTNENVSFPYGSAITYRGRGWYMLKACNDTRVTDKIVFALKVLRKFEQIEEERIVADIKALETLILNPDLHVAAQTDNGLSYLSNRQFKVPDGLVAQSKLQALVSKFSHTKGR